MAASACVSGVVVAAPVEECRTLQDNSQRLACYDRLYGGPAALSHDASQVSAPIAEAVAEPGPAGVTAPIGADAEVRTRIEQEQRLVDAPFTIIPHKPTYILPLTYAKDPNEQPFSPAGRSR